MKMRPVYLLTILLVGFPIRCFSKTEVKDSIAVRHFEMDNFVGESDTEISGLSPAVISLPKYGMYGAASMHRLLDDKAYNIDLRIPNFQFTPGQASLLHWNSGAIVAAGSIASFPGMMQIESGSFGLHQSAGNFTFYAGGMVNKYGYFNSLHTQYGVNGRISYKITPNLSATVFGEYYFGRPPQMANGMPMPPSMIGFYGQSKFGGYFDYRINGRWGVQTGVQTVQQVGTNKFHAEPIVTPYYKISKKVSIGLPVGQILYHVLKK